MSDYVKLDDLVAALKAIDAPYSCIAENLPLKSEDDIAESMSPHFIRAALDKHGTVIAVQMWTKGDIISALEKKHVKDCMNDSLIEEIAKEAKNALEDCSDNWERLEWIIDDVLNRPEWIINNMSKMVDDVSKGAGK